MKTHRSIQCFLESLPTRPLEEFAPTRDFPRGVLATDRFWNDARTTFTYPRTDSPHVGELNGFLEAASLAAVAALSDHRLGVLRSEFVLVNDQPSSVWLVKVAEDRVLLLSAEEAVSVARKVGGGS